MLLPEVESLGEIRGRPQCDKCGCRVRIAHSIVSRLWRQFQNYRNSYPGFSTGLPRGTTPADDPYIVLQARRNKRQTAEEIAKTHDTGDWMTDIPFYRGQKTARWWSVCSTPCTVCTFNLTIKVSCQRAGV
ncbi:hypothetical protein TNCV_1969431 [Trichonephila clavipes]|nr:hypothetical protein TNCV_1969431 [Trichonephila clavipes]